MSGSTISSCGPNRLSNAPRTRIFSPARAVKRSAGRLERRLRLARGDDRKGAAPAQIKIEARAAEANPAHHALDDDEAPVAPRQCGERRRRRARHNRDRARRQVLSRAPRIPGRVGRPRSRASRIPAEPAPGRRRSAPRRRRRARRRKRARRGRRARGPSGRAAAETSDSAASRPTKRFASSVARRRRQRRVAARRKREGRGRRACSVRPSASAISPPFVDRGGLNRPRRRAAGRRPPGRRGRAPAPKRASRRRRRADRARCVGANFMLEALRRCETAFSPFAPRGHRPRARGDGKARRPAATGGRRRPGSSAG